MQVTVHLVPQVAQELKHGAVESDAAREVLNVVKEMGLELRPMHPGSGDPDMAATFVVETPDDETAALVAARLNKVKAATRSAYRKPRPGMP